MKNTILVSLAFSFIGFGGIFAIFDNPYGIPMVVIGSFIGLHLMNEDEKKYSDEGLHEKYEPRRHEGNRGSN